MRALLLCSLALVACGEDPPPASDTEACAQLDMGPYVPVNASVSRDVATPAVAVDANAYAVTLTQNGFGYVKLEATAGKHVVYLDRALMVNILEGQGTPATLSSATSSAACMTIKGRHEATLAAGTAYIGLQSDGAGPVNLVVATP